MKINTIILIDKDQVKKQKFLEKLRKKITFSYTKTSFERESKVKKFFDEQIRSGKLERTDESYEKYYR